MKFLTGCAVSIFLLSLASCLWAETSQGADSKIPVIQSIQTNGAIETRVFYFDEQTPLPYVRIRTDDSLDVIIADEVSDSLGRYILSLPPGRYHEHLTKIGFNSEDRNNIIVVADETTHVSINMMITTCCCVYVVGDVNNSGMLSGQDVTYSVRYFKGGYPPPHSCECPPGHFWFTPGDVNGSCSFTGADVTCLVRHFKSGTPLMFCPDCPPPPGAR
jgi:hypothetical protein